MFKHWLIVLKLTLVLAILPWPKSHAQSLGEQVVTDLVTIGITGAATLSGNIPLAMASGVLAKYISTYGIQGVKFLINKVKADPPQDLGEINIYYVYLIHAKRNLFQAMINLRTNVQNDKSKTTLLTEIEELEKTLRSACPEEGCKIEGIDESLVNFQFLNIALDAKESFYIFDYLDDQEVKMTYQYLMLLYMDIILVEQKLLESQYNVLANQVNELVGNLEKNVYLSNDEKEYAFELCMSVVLKWQLERDNRRVVLLQSLANPLKAMEIENDKIQDEINGYQDANDDLRKLMLMEF